MEPTSGLEPLTCPITKHCVLLTSQALTRLATTRPILSNQWITSAQDTNILGYGPRLTSFSVLIATLNDFVETGRQSVSIELILHHDDLCLLEESPDDVLVCLCVRHPISGLVAARGV